MRCTFCVFYVSLPKKLVRVNTTIINDRNYLYNPHLRGFQRPLSVDSQFHLNFFTESVHMDDVCLYQEEQQRLNECSFDNTSVKQEIFLCSIVIGYFSLCILWSYP